MKKGYLKLHLTLAINRLKMTQAKKASLRQTARRGISELLAAGKEESARIRVEQIIREDFMIESMEIVELYCELLIGRFALLEQKSKKVDPSLIEPIMTIIYAAPRMEVKELLEVREEFIFKFGKEFTNLDLDDKMSRVNPKVIQKLSIYAPDPYLVEQYLKEIAKFFDVPWTPSHPALPPSSRGPLIDTRPIGDELKGLQGFPTMVPYHPTAGSSAVLTAPSTSTRGPGNEQGSLVHPQQPSPPPPPPSLPVHTIPGPTVSPSESSSYQHYMPPHYVEHPSPWAPPASQIDADEKKPWTTNPSPPPGTANMPSPSPPAPPSVPDFDDLARRFEALKKGRP